MAETAIQKSILHFSAAPITRDQPQAGSSGIQPPDKDGDETAVDDQPSLSASPSS